MKALQKETYKRRNPECTDTPVEYKPMTKRSAQSYMEHFRDVRTALDAERFERWGSEL